MKWDEKLCLFSKSTRSPAPYPTKRELPSPQIWPPTDSSLSRPLPPQQSSTTTASPAPPSQQQQQQQQQHHHPKDAKREKRSNQEMVDSKTVRAPDTGVDAGKPASLSSSAGKSKQSGSKSNHGAGVKNSAAKVERQRVSGASTAAPASSASTTANLDKSHKAKNEGNTNVVIKVE